MREPTFSRTDFVASRAQWDEGKFSDEWKPWRHRAAMRGMIYPPEGTRFDQWDDDSPSQRAILIRAIRETPELLGRAIDRSRSWGQVIGYLLVELNGQADLIERRERERARLDPDPREATVTIKRILERIGNS